MKKRNFCLILFLMIFAIILPFGVNAEVKTVTTEEELKSAVDDSTITEIIINADIETNGKINITRDLTLDGNGHSITYVGKFFKDANSEGSDDNTIWSKKSSDGTAGAVYVIQVYKANVEIKDIVLAGGNRGLGINGSTVTLDGTIGFVNNGYQDIELSNGVDVTGTPTLKLTDNAIVTTDNETDEVESWLILADSVDVNINGKTVSANKSLRASSIGAPVIAVDTVKEDSKVSENIFTEAKNSGSLINFGYTDDDGDLLYLWSFDANDIEKPMDVNTGVTFTEDAPEEINSDLSKLVTNYNDVMFMNFMHDGVLPGKATITYDVSSKYSVGTKLYIAHYNETTKELESIGEATVSRDGTVSFDIKECSSYVLYTGVDSNDQTNTSLDAVGNNVNSVENVKTGDIHLIGLISVFSVTAIGLFITCKKLVTR